MSHSIFYHDFDVPFFSCLEEKLDHEGDRYARKNHLFLMQSLIPKDVLYLGSIDSDIDHSPGLSWEIKEHFYLVPGTSDLYDWGMLRISWDDNWGKYEHIAEVVVKGIKEPKEAGISIVEFMFAEWGYDLDDEDNQIYKKFLESL
jgi:hypothetical protein